MKTLVLANQKGGVGKSAVATLLAHHLHRAGRRVLAVDLDHQGNLSSILQRSNRALSAPVTADALLTSARVDVPAGTFVLVPAADALLGLERQPAQHTPFARNLRAFLRAQAGRFDVCIVDTNPNPDIRVIAALASADFVLSPIQLNQEAIDGVRGLLHHPRVGVHKIRAVLNPALRLVGLLPTMVEATPFQKANFVEIIRHHQSLLIPIGERAGEFAFIPKRSAIAEAQAHGEILWEMKKTAARDAWTEVEPTMRRLSDIVFAKEDEHVA
ncbi:chromosome partitioning protein [Rubrivivax gelatinosus]|uniref:ParA family protein n=1 Tax=Rubrivivax gelatinosus TaxID=28068 RepID=UPI001905A803|nr:ParA family protein [Rubrivivax gelatinosus]MBK1613070.1 chromosome partitioning protein [Rubrivivax gelatinosus]